MQSKANPMKWQAATDFIYVLNRRWFLFERCVYAHISVFANVDIT